MEFTPEDIKQLRRQCPNTAVLVVLQSTKQGSFRGSQSYKHDCDIFVEIKKFQVVQEKARGQEAAASVAIEHLFY